MSSEYSQSNDDAAGPSDFESHENINIELKDLSAQASSIGGAEIPTATTSPQIEPRSSSAGTALIFWLIFFAIPSLIIGLCFGLGLGPEWRRIGRMEKTSCLITEYSARERRSCGKRSCSYFREIKSRVRTTFHRPAGGGAVGDVELTYEGAAQTYRCPAKVSGIFRTTRNYDHCPTQSQDKMWTCFADDGQRREGFGAKKEPKIYFSTKINPTILGVCIFFLIVGFLLLIPGLLAIFFGILSFFSR